MPHLESDPIFQLVGNTPMVPLNRLFANNKGIEVFAKLEYYNPSGSVKDRIIAHILGDAIKTGKLKPGMTLVEASSGNTGAALALFCARLGYKLILTTMAKVSEEKKNHIRMLGAELIVCPTAVHHDSPEHYINRAAQIARETPNSFHINQYDNPLNTEAHYLTTGPEIWRQMDGRVDWLVTGGSTGGTVTGAAKYLKEKNPALKVLLPDPKGSALYHLAKTGVSRDEDLGPYQVEGVGKECLTKAMDISLVDEAMQYSDADAFGLCRTCARMEGILPGLSAGGNLAGVQWLIERIPGPRLVPDQWSGTASTRIVTLIQDAGVKYLSKLLKD